MAAAAVEDPGIYSTSGILLSAQSRHWAQAWLWVEIRRMSSSRVPGRATSTKLIETRASRRIRSSCPVAIASRVAVTPPSTEFSIGTIAASAEPSRTLSSAVLTFDDRMRTAPPAPGTRLQAHPGEGPAGSRGG